MKSQFISKYLISSNLTQLSFRNDFDTVGILLIYDVSLSMSQAFAEKQLFKESPIFKASEKYYLKLPLTIEAVKILKAY